MEKRLRILMMIHRQADNSPYCFYVHEQAKALMARGHEVVVISAVGVTPMMKRLRPGQAEVAARTPKEAVVDGVRVFYPRYLTLGNAGERLLGGRLLAASALPVAKALHREKPFDLVHAHMLPRDGHAGLIVARALGIPFALTVSTLLMSRVAPYRGGEKLSRVVPNGVDLSLVPQKTDNTPRAVISVGTLKARKCMDRTLEAFARLAGEYPDATLTIVGIGEMEAQLRARIAELGLEGRVTLTGGLPHEEVLARMAKSDLFVLPSWGEGYGIVYIEAMAAGCIAVGTQGEGIEDTITDGENGFLVPAGDIDATERVMRAVFENRERYAALREKGRRDARALTWARNAQTVEEIYFELLNSGGNNHAQTRH